MVRILGGTVLGQAITFALTPILLIEYPPSAFGRMAAALGLALAGATALTLRFDLAVPIPVDDKEARRLATTGALAAALGTTTALVLMTGWTFFGSLPIWVFICPLIAALSGLLQILNAQSLRQHDFNPVATRAIVQAATAGTFQIGWAMVMSPTTFGLLAGFALGQAVTLVINSRKLKNCFAPISYASSTELLAKFSQFPTQLMPAGVLNTLAVQSPAILTTALFGAGIGGQLALAQRLLGLPIGLITQSASSVFLAEASQHTRDRDYLRLKRAYERTSTGLTVASILFLLATLALGPWAVNQFFAPKWHESGEILIILAMMTAAQLVVSPVSQVLILLGRTRTQLVYDAARLTFIAAVLIIGRQVGAPFDATLLAMALLSAATYVYLWVLGHRAIRQFIVEQ